MGRMAWHGRYYTKLTQQRARFHYRNVFFAPTACHGCLECGTQSRMWNGMDEIWLTEQDTWGVGHTQYYAAQYKYSTVRGSKAPPASVPFRASGVNGQKWVSGISM